MNATCSTETGRADRSDRATGVYGALCPSTATVPGGDWESGRWG